MIGNHDHEEGKEHSHATWGATSSMDSATIWPGDADEEALFAGFIAALHQEKEEGRDEKEHDVEGDHGIFKLFLEMEICGHV